MKMVPILEAKLRRELGNYLDNRRVQVSLKEVGIGKHPDYREEEAAPVFV
jgi:hypothetical protein